VRVCEHCGVENVRKGNRFCSLDCAYKNRSENFEERFWNRVDKSGGEDACWIWLGASSKKGYGHLSYRENGKMRWMGAHRMAFILTHGPIPDAMFVCHKCDNPPCCNSRHHFLGSGADNLRDAAIKGRMIDSATTEGRARGEGHGRAKLTAADAVEVVCLYRDAGLSLSKIGTRFGVTAKTIHAVVTGRTWGSATGLTPETGLWRRRGEGGNRQPSKVPPEALIGAFTRFLAGEQLDELAKDFGVHPTTLRRLLKPIREKNKVSWPYPDPHPYVYTERP
jgi:hypothetical protein